MIMSQVLPCDIKTGMSEACEKKAALDLKIFQLVLVIYGSLHVGLTGKVAEWAVHKQKSHQRVSPQAIILGCHAIVNVN